MSARLLITLGDVAGIGPEVVLKAWPGLTQFCRPIVIGDPDWLRRQLPRKSSLEIVEIREPEEAQPRAHVLCCLRGSSENLDQVEQGKVSAAAGRAAYDFLCQAIDLSLDRRADGIVTCPLHKEGLKAAGLNYPGHTEILAERTGTRQFAMMLFGRNANLPHGLGVVHVTLHLALKEVFANLSVQAVREKIELLWEVMQRLSDRRPRLAVLALNPHASDGGLFGTEEEKIIQPAIQAAQKAGIDVSGPWASDTLFGKAARGEFDGIVAMYHDQGHIPMKLLAGFQAVNISLGLPIVRTSVAHGTAYDIAGRGLADPTSLLEAARVASLLQRSR